MNIIKSIALWFCQHPSDQLVFKRNIGGDQMRIYSTRNGLARSEWVCARCQGRLYMTFRVDE